MVHAVEKAIAASNLGLTPSTEGQVLRLRIPELNEERRRELVKVAHKYSEAARVAVRHVRRDGRCGRSQWRPMAGVATYVDSSPSS